MEKKFIAFVEILFDCILSERKAKTKVICIEVRYLKVTALSILLKLSFLRCKYIKKQKDSQNKFYDLKEAILDRVWNTFEKVKAEDLLQFFNYISKYSDLTLLTLQKFENRINDSKKVTEMTYTVLFKFFVSISEEFPSKKFSQFLDNPLKRKLEKQENETEEESLDSQIKSGISNV